MNVVAKIIIGVSLFAASCSEQEDLGYRIDCRIDSGVEADSVKVYCYDEGYRALRLLGAHSIASEGRIVKLKGRIDAPSIAFVEIHNNFMRERVYFILENDDIELSIGNGFLNIRGGELNNAYFKVFAERRGIVNRRKSLRRGYDEAVKNDAITDSLDKAYFSADKLLADSLQRLYSRTLNMNNIVTSAVWCQFGNEFNESEQLKKKLAKDSLLHNFVK